jgi:predicted acyl esterase
MVRWLLAGLVLTLFSTAAAADTFQVGAGTEGRRWLPETPTAETSAKRYPIAIEDGTIVTTRDGVRLEGRLFLPTLAVGEKPTPCVLLSDGYGRESNAGASFDGPLFELASRGYAVLHLSLRGSGKSGGVSDLYAHFGEDGYDAIEWMAKQPWCNGSVAMVGPSLLGISQWLTAKEGPPHLKAIVPDVACGDCYGELWYPGGMRPGPGREARKLAPGAEAEYATAIQHPNFDSWWRIRTTLADSAAEIGKRGVAVFVAGGQDDYISPANLRLFTELGAGAHKRLLFGSYAHGWHTQLFQELQVQWLDHWLKGESNGADTAARVMLFVKGANRWRLEDDWPLPDAHATRLYFSSAPRGSVDSLNDGVLDARAPTSSAMVALPYTPEEGPFLPVLLSATKGRSNADQRPFERKVATWTTAPISVATEVTGYPRVTIWATSSAADGDLVFSLNDVGPDGVSHQVMQGYVNAPHAADLHSAPTPIEPGEPKRYELELFPMAYVFPAGHRIRLAVAGGADAAAGTPFPQGPGKNPQANTWTISMDAEHASSIDLPIIGSAWSSLTQ